MNALIVKILKEISFDKKFVELCSIFCEWDKAKNLNRKEIEPIIKAYDLGFKYVSGDRVFVKNVVYKYNEFSIRLFISFKGGLINFSYLIWKEGEVNKFYKGSLVHLAMMLDPNVKGKIKYNSLIATSLLDFKAILSEIFTLFNAFHKRFIELEQN